MVAILDWADLRIAVASKVGNREISDVLDMLCVFAEKEMEQKIRHRLMMVDGTLAFVDGVAPLPSDFLETDRLIHSSSDKMASTSFLSKRNWYEVIGSNMVADVGTSTLRHVYYRTIPTLTASSTTSNWLLERFPLAYLYAVSFEAAKWLKDSELSAALMVLRDDQFQIVSVDGERSAFGDARVRFSGAASCL